MRGLVLAQGLGLQTDRPKPAPKPQEAIIQVLQAGICSTDLHIVKGYMDFQGVLGMSSWVSLITRQVILHLLENEWSGKSMLRAVSVPHVKLGAQLIAQIAPH